MVSCLLAVTQTIPCSPLTIVLYFSYQVSNELHASHVYPIVPNNVFHVRLNEASYMFINPEVMYFRSGNLTILYK